MFNQSLVNKCIKDSIFVDKPKQKDIMRYDFYGNISSGSTCTCFRAYSVKGNPSPYHLFYQMFFLDIFLYNKKTLVKLESIKIDKNDQI